MRFVLEIEKTRGHGYFISGNYGAEFAKSPAEAVRKAKEMLDKYELEKHR